MLPLRRGHALLLAFVVVSVGLAACSSGNQPSVKIELAPLSALPAEVQQAEPKVREAYQFAIANQEYLKNFPCYCGCGAMDHKNNLECYIDEVRPDGTILFDNHAFL